MDTNGTVEVSFNDNIAIVTFNCGENRLNNGFIKKVHEALDKVERNENVHAMITTGTGKMYSEGIDLNWLRKTSTDQIKNFGEEALPSLYSRLMTFPMLTIAAINGHAFAGGALLAFCHDYRVMRNKKGWISMNEVHIKLKDIKMRFTQYFLKVLKARLPRGQVYHECMALGKIYTVEEAVKDGIVDIACDEEILLQSSKDLVKKTIPKGPYDRGSLGNMKKDMYDHIFQRPLHSDGAADAMKAKL